MNKKGRMKTKDFDIVVQVLLVNVEKPAVRFTGRILVLPEK
jgi:hypothetical protein